jgi:predicted nuclease of predicted toxin-antitoxin system
MVEPVVDLLVGRGHRVIRARDAGIAGEIDIVVADYALIDDLVIVTFDPDMRRVIRRRGEGRCLYVRPPELTARARLAEHYNAVIDLFVRRARLVTLPPAGTPYDPHERRRNR